MNPYSKELTIACLAVQRAAILTRDLLSIVDKGALEKADLSPVTVGDFATQALLISALHYNFPSDHFVGEESADELRKKPALLKRVWELVRNTHLDDADEVFLPHPSSLDDMLRLIDLGGAGQGGREGRTWVLDPIDGTATFIQGQQYAINLALLVRGEQQLGVIGCPNLPATPGTIEETRVDTDGHGCLLSAIKGHGAYIRLMTTGMLSPATLIQKHANSVKVEDIKVTECTTTSSMVLSLHREVFDRLGAAWPGTDLWSSLMKYVALTIGGCNVNVRIVKSQSYKSCIWDHAGGQLIFEEVGGKVTDINGKHIDFGLGRQMSANFGLVCAPANLHAQILKVVQEVIAAEPHMVAP
ncbi:myo-inositol-1-monophosphatase [Pseudovirgaria hyperparasitica]|uniref:Myo-inositol-1-monophosphatase n=1 Tax=Pseudovirgaria hyperparasitica TaxID=470096 RepID=A0A6A6VU90_9PEZI|nr:myo-inositol-1-monophosphatase [Pseudovirgaria hyperparasitica]KAF2752811.1 myo-inositol-1-monophosphatase [Pseudovirgaria hyperparasitica]